MNTILLELAFDLFDMFEVFQEIVYKHLDHLQIGSIQKSL